MRTYHVFQKGFLKAPITEIGRVLGGSGDLVTGYFKDL